LRFLKAYFDQPLRRTLAEEAASLAFLKREGDRLMIRYTRKFAPGASI
jgi:heptose I phosphotransferase